MPGLLSNVFDARDDSGSSQSSQSYQADAEQDFNFTPEVTVESEMGGSYENPDGSTTAWSNSNSATLDEDVGLSTAANAGATMDESDVY